MPSRAETLAQSYAIPRPVRDLDAVLDDIDGVVLATPPAHHAPATMALAARGKHVFVEKPMATTADDAARMVAAADAAAVTLAVGLYAVWLAAPSRSTRRKAARMGGSSPRSMC
jgi:1,5-anhydro-D-fructose reductase (1,5-anhydro-D-mannitol-forming)